jgi:phosphohistidine phosphatase SixA
VKHIFTTELARTRQTAAPLAEAIQVNASAVSSRDVAALAQQVRAAAGNVLVVGHSNTVPELLKQLGVKAPVTIGDSEYDNLFIVFRPAAGEPTMIRLRY